MHFMWRQRRRWSGLSSGKAAALKPIKAFLPLCKLVQWLRSLHCPIFTVSLISHMHMSVLSVRQRLLYTVGHPLSRDILLSIFDMFSRPLGWCCSYCAAQLVTGTSVRKHNKTSRLSGRPRVYRGNSTNIYPGEQILFTAISTLSDNSFCALKGKI